MPKVILSLFVLFVIFVIFHTLTPGAFKLPTLILQLLINTYDRIISNLAYRVNSIKYELWSIFHGMKKTEKAYFLKLLGLFYYIQSYNLYSVAFIASLLFYILCRNNIYASSIFTVIVCRSGYLRSCSFVSLISSISPGATTGRFLWITLSSSKYALM